jgi:hypothetical protein
VVCIHIKCRGLARSRILPAGKQTWSRLASVLRYAASETAVHAGEGWAPTKAALITYRELVRALDRQPADGPLAQWQAAVAELAPEFVWTGYFGGTSRASSAFEGVDLLVTLGDPWPNISGRRVDLAAMGVSPDEVDDRMRAEVATKLGQIMGRARAKTALLIHIGSVLPAGWDAATVVTVESRPPGRPPAQDAAAWRSWLERAAETLGAVSEPLVRAVVSAAKQSAAPRWVSGVLAHAGAPPQGLPPDRRLRKLIDEATRGRGGEQWAQRVTASASART